MKKTVVKSLVLSSFLLVLLSVGLAFTPHHTCGCGQYEDGSQLTNIINTIAEKAFGEPLIENNPPLYH